MSDQMVAKSFVQWLIILNVMLREYPLFRVLNSTKDLESSRYQAKITEETISQVKSLLNTGKTLVEVAAEVGLSVASWPKIKAGAYNS